MSLDLIVRTPELLFWTFGQKLSLQTFLTREFSIQKPVFLKWTQMTIWPFDFYQGLIFVGVCLDNFKFMSFCLDIKHDFRTFSFVIFNDTSLGETSGSKSFKRIALCWEDGSKHFGHWQLSLIHTPGYWRILWNQKLLFQELWIDAEIDWWAATVTSSAVLIKTSLPSIHASSTKIQICFSLFQVWVSKTIE